MGRPIISEFPDTNTFVKEMIAYLKTNERSFSVLNRCRKLRKLSPSLVTLICKGERKVTLDRVDSLAKLLKLTPQERHYFHDWVRREETGLTEPMPATADQSPTRKRSTSHLLKDWINAYVKDAHQLTQVQADKSELYSVLSGIASQSRIDKSIGFLLKEGYLRKTIDGNIVEDTRLNIVDEQVPDKLVKQFHKGALKTAINAIDAFPIERRLNNTLIVPLDKDGYEDLLEIINEFAQQLQTFAESRTQGTGLYQLIINLNPTGGHNDQT